MDTPATTRRGPQSTGLAMRSDCDGGMHRRYGMKKGGSRTSETASDDGLSGALGL